MPRNVRNFWLDINVDGSKTRIGTGPIRKDGGFEMRILQRDNGDIIEAASIWGIAHDDGTITLRIQPRATPPADQETIEIRTKR